MQMLTFQFAVERSADGAVEEFFFRTFHRFQKSAQSAGRSSAGVAAYSSSWTPGLMSQGNSCRRRRRRTPAAGLMSTAARAGGSVQFQGGGTCSALAWTWTSSGTSPVRARWVPGEAVVVASAPVIMQLEFPQS